MLRIITLLLFCPLLTFSANKYVSGTGSDSNSGTLASPYRTIDKIDAISLSGIDTVYFERGYDYNGSLQKANNNTVYAAYGSGYKPLMIYSGSAGQGDREVFRFTGDNIKVIGLNFTYPSQNPDRSVVAYVSIAVVFDGSDNNFVNDCLFSKVGCGIFYTNSNGNTTLQDTANDMRMIVSDGASDNDFGANFVIYDDASDNTISHSECDSCLAPSVDYGIDGGFAENYNPCSNNKTIYCTANKCNGMMEIGSGSGGTSADNMVAYCKITACGELTYTSADGGFPVQCLNMQYYNNVIIDTTGGFGFGACFNYAGTQTNDTVFNLKNNIFYLKGGIDVVATSDALRTNHQNNFYDLSGGSSAGFTLKPSEATTNVQNQFVNLTTGNYHLKSGATAIGAGQTIAGTAWTAFDFVGNSIGVPPNLGVYGQTPPTNQIVLPANINGKTYTKFQ